MPPTGIAIDETDHHHHQQDYKSFFDHTHTNGNGAHLVETEETDSEDNIYTEVHKLTRYKIKDNYIKFFFRKLTC